MRLISISLAALSLAIWVLLGAMGLRALASITHQKVPGFPNTSQISLYAILPIALSFFAVACLIYVIIGKGTKSAALVSVIILLPVLPYMLLFGGGV